MMHHSTNKPQKHSIGKRLLSLYLLLSYLLVSCGHENYDSPSQPHHRVVEPAASPIQSTSDYLRIGEAEPAESNTPPPSNSDYIENTASIIIPFAPPVTKPTGFFSSHSGYGVQDPSNDYIQATTSSNSYATQPLTPGRENKPRRDSSAEEDPYSDHEEELYADHESDTEPAAPQAVDPDNALFNSLVGTNRLPTGQIEISTKLGNGAFGQVFKGEWNDKPVALKRIDINAAANTLNITTGDAKDALRWEVARLSTVSHPNLVQFYGIYQHENESHTYLVLELCEGGEIGKRLAQEPNLPFSKRWQWALEVSQALGYLHQQGVLHRDLKAENVLLDRQGRAKLADLGVAQVDALLAVQETQVVAQGMQDKKFIAPENLANPTLSTPATDVYALGLVLWQLITGEEPRKLIEINQYSWQIGDTIEREPIPANCPSSFKELILDCWQHDPAKRPTIDRVIARLKAMGVEHSKHATLVQNCHQLEAQIHAQRKELLSYVEPYMTHQAVEGQVEAYWQKWEATQKDQQGTNPPASLSQALETFLQSPGPGTLLLLGEAGQGKSLTTYGWADKLLQDWWAYTNGTAPQPPYFPVFVRPHLATWSHTSLKGACKKIIQDQQLENIPLLIIVDGYDELQQMPAEAVNIAEHLGLTSKNQAKLLITCRPSTIKPENLAAQLSFEDKLQTCHLLPLTTDQLLAYLKKELAWTKETQAAYQEKIAQAPSLRLALRNPYVLHLFKESFETLAKEPLDLLTRSKIYEGFIRHTLLSNSKLLSPSVLQKLTHTYPDLVTSFEAFAQAVALKAYHNKSITYGSVATASQIGTGWVQLETLVGEAAHHQFEERKEELRQQEARMQREGGEKEKIAAYRRRALLKGEDFRKLMQERRAQFETALPLTLRGQAYGYTHKSLFEYFLAKHLQELADNPAGSITEKAWNDLVYGLINREPAVLVGWHEAWEEQVGKNLLATDLLTTLQRQGKPDPVLSKLAALLDATGRVLQARGQYARARTPYEQALVLREKVLGFNHSSVATSYNEMGLLLQAQGQYEEALGYYKKALVIFENVLGPDHPDVATSYNNIGHLLQTQGQYKEALVYYQKALAIREKVLGPDHSDVATSYGCMGSLLQAQGQYEEALVYYKKYVAIFEKVLGLDHPSVATSYACMGNLLQAQGQYKEALVYYQKALAIREKVLGPDHSDVATSYGCMGSLLQAQGQYEEALVYYKKYVAIFEKVLGLDHPSVATSYACMGNLLQAQGQYKEALVYYQKALAIREKVLGPDHSDVATSYNNMGNLLKAQGQYEGALVYYKKALAIREKVLDLDHPDVATSYACMGSLLQAQGQYQEALVYYQKSLVISEKVLGPDHPNVANFYSCIGIVLQAQGQYQEALGYYQKALAIREKALGPDHSDVATSYVCMGSLLQAQGQYGEALVYYKKDLAIREKVLGPDHPDLANTYSGIGIVLREQGQYAESLVCFKKALAIREEVLGFDHPHVAFTHNNMGLLLQKQGEYAEALVWYNKALDLRKKVLAPDHPDLATSYHNMATLLQDQGDHGAALDCYQKTLAIREKKLGLDHPDTKKSRENIAALQKKLIA